MLVIVAAFAITFYVLRRSNQGFLGLPPGYLGGLPGLVLAILIAGTHLFAAMLLVGQAPRARLVALIAALLVIVASVVLIMSMLGVAWFPAVLFFIGFVEVLLVGGSTPRKPVHRKHVPGRR